MYDPGRSNDGQAAVTIASFQIGDSVLCGQTESSYTECDTQSGRTIGMTVGVHGILAGATEIVHFCEILTQERDYSVVSCLGEETGALMEQSLRQESDLSLNPQPNLCKIIKAIAKL